MLVSLFFWNKYKIMSLSQHGFRNSVSTEDAESSLTSLLIGQILSGVLFDINKAFDTVSVFIRTNYNK